MEQTVDQTKMIDYRQLTDEQILILLKIKVKWIDSEEIDSIPKMWRGIMNVLPSQQHIVVATDRLGIDFIKEPTEETKRLHAIKWKL